MNILVKETTLKESLKVFNKIPEFDRQEAGTVKYCEKRILSKMMRIYEEYAKKNNYKEITIKTDNSKREMLNYLVKNNWNFVDVITKSDIKDNEILLKKEI